MKVRPHFLFGIPRSVTFPGLELDIDRLESIVVNKANNREAQVAFVQQSGMRQSALEHLIPELQFTDAQPPVGAVSAVKALALASRQGQRLYQITQDNVASVMSQLHLDSEVTSEIQQAVATGKHAIVSQYDVTVGSWTGVGYLIIDPETGSGAYKISGGANGAFMYGALLGVVLLFTVLLIVSFPASLIILLLGLIGIAPGMINSIDHLKVVYDVIKSAPECFWTGVSATFVVLGLILWLLPVLAVVSAISVFVFGGIALTLAISQVYTIGTETFTSCFS